MFRYTYITLIILSIVTNPIHAFAAANKPVKATLLKIEEAIALGIKADADVTNAKNNVSQKRTEWKQSLQAILNEAQKDASSFARPHSLSKDLSIRMKLPEARKSLAEAQEMLVQQQYMASEKVRKLYINVLSSMNSVIDAEKKLNDSIHKIIEVKTMIKLNKAKQSDLKEADDVRKDAESNVKMAQLNYKSVLLDLSSAIGLDVEQGYTFDIQPVYADLKKDTIWKLVSYAEKNDTSLSSAMMNRSIANEKVNVTRQLYESKFGSTDMKIIQSMFTKDINEELFEANYESFLEKVSKQWDGFIPLLIPLPKSLFQGEFDGIRYFDDQRYSLPVSLFELNKARKKEQDTLEQLLTSVKTSYLSVKTAEEQYSMSLQEQDVAKLKLSTAKKLLKAKQLTQEEYSGIEDAFNEARKEVAVSYLSYYSAIYKLDFDTSGGIQPFIRQGILPWQTMDDGLSPINVSPEQDKPLIGTFAIESVVDPITSSLQMDVDSSMGATHYQLFTMDNIPLTERIKVGKPIIALHLMLQSITDYQAIFFKQQAPVAQATFDGVGTSGSMLIQRISSFDAQVVDDSKPKRSNQLGTVVIGTFQIALSQLTKEIATVALSTVSESGQGLYYKAANASDLWFDLEKTVDYKDILMNLKSVAVNPNIIKSLTISVSIQTEGTIKSLQAPEQVQLVINNLVKSIDKLQAQADEASEGGQLLDFAQIMQEIEVTMSKKAFLESLLIGNSAIILSQLKELGATQAGEAPTPDSSNNELEMLTAEADKLSNQLMLAIKASNVDQILQASTLLVEALVTQLSVEQGVQQDIDALLAAQTRLEGAYKDAQQTKDSDRKLIINEALFAVQLELSKALKSGKFVEKQALELVIAQLALQNQQTDQLLQLRTAAINAIVGFEKLKYAEQELNQVEEEASIITELYDGLVEPIPVQNVISRSLDIKLISPPIFTRGQAMIQIRPISESLDALVVWNEMDQSVTITKNGIVLICTVGNPIAYVDGQPFMMDTYPQLISGRVVVPLRFVAESLGIEAEWDSATQTIELISKGDIQQ